MSEKTIKITADGDVIALYEDDSPLRELGKIEVTRASKVEFNSETQMWVVKIMDAGMKEWVPVKAFPRRADAITHEIWYLNEALQFLIFTPEKLFKSQPASNSAV